MRSMLIQIAAVGTAIAILTVLTDHWNYRTGLNIIWMLGVPIAVAVLANRNAGSRLLVSLVLIVCSPVAMMGTAAVFGLGP